MCVPERDFKREGRARYQPRPPRWVGFRGRFLTLVGFAYIAQGITSAEDWGLAPHEEIPEWGRVAIWAVAGLIAIGTAWRPPGFRDEVGWVCLYFPPAIWAGSYLISWVDYICPGGGPGYELGWVSVLVWGFVGAVIYICADWPEPPVLPVDPDVET